MTSSQQIGVYMKKVLVCSLLTVFFLSACSVKTSTSAGVDGKVDQPPADNQQNQVLQLQIGTSNAPSSNEASLTEAQKKGGTIEWTWTAENDGSIEFNSAAKAWIGCAASPFDDKLILIDSNKNETSIYLPYSLAQVKDENYTLRLVVHENDCLGASFSFTVAKVDLSSKPAEPILPISPQPKSPKPEEGFLGEEKLSSSGGSFFLDKITNDVVYKDFIISTKEEIQIYKSVGFGSSYCTPAQRPSLEILEIDVDGNILNRVELTSAKTIYPSKYYRLRFSMKNLKKCSYVSESFNVSYH